VLETLRPCRYGAALAVSLFHRHLILSIIHCFAFQYNATERIVANSSVQPVDEFGDD
jgi:hypothetical protein